METDHAAPRATLLRERKQTATPHAGGPPQGPMGAALLSSASDRTVQAAPRAALLTKRYGTTSPPEPGLQRTNEDAPLAARFVRGEDQTVVAVDHDALSRDQRRGAVANP